MGRQSREALAMEGSDGENLSFGRKNGCFISNSVMVFCFLLFLTSLVTTGLLVYYYAGNGSETGDDNHVEYSIMKSSSHDKVAAGDKSAGAETKTMKKKTMDVRLPKDIKPIHYFVRLIPYINGNFSINGYVEFTFEVLKETRSITLHINDIVTKNDTVKVYPESKGEGSSIKIMNHMFDKERQFYIAKTKSPLMAGKKYVIAMEYTGYLNDDMDGFYRSSYKDGNGNKRWLAATQFQPTDARKAFPCLDEPALKANFTVILGREDKMNSISNMPKSSTTPMEGRPGWQWDSFQTSVAMSTYLVAFVISDFIPLESHGAVKYQFRVWARNSAIQQAEYAIEIGPPISKFFEDFFDIPFPLPKQDMIALPDFSAGAMENWGLITYRETAMLFDQKLSKASDKSYIAVVISHELAHQWFGNLVTPSWWTDLWLNEGFASYIEYLGVDHVEPSFKIMEQFVIIDTQPVFELDCLESSHPISIPVNHPSEINEIFDKISYSKGAAIIRMMSHFLTEKTFKKGLTNYLRAYAYDNAEQDDLWRHLTEQAHADGTLQRGITVKKIMDTWTLQMGFPVITVMNQGNGMAKLKQDRFLLVKSENFTDTHDYKWWVPINFASEDNPDFESTKPTEWLMPTESEKIIRGIPTSGWFVLNVKETGYYRVNYDEQSWNAIIGALQRRHTVIDEVNRAQLIDDSLSLSRAGLLNYKMAMSLLSYLDKEDEYIPWKAALNNLGFIRGMLVEKGGYGSFKAFMDTLIIPMYNKIGFVDSISDPHLDQRKRALILSWACELGYQPCIDESLKLLRQWKTQPDNYGLISPNLKWVVYCTAVEHGGIEEWKFIWGRYEKANVAAEKRNLLMALGCSKKAWILSGFLERGLQEGKGIRKQDFATVIAAVAGNDVGRSIAWEFLKDKWDRILEYYGDSVSFTLGRIIKSVTKRLNTENQLKELKDFKMKYSGRMSSAERAVEQSIENTKNNLEWINKYYDVIMQWLSANKFDNSI